ncbi:hypothetical protein A9Q84_05135 [Halobacteriovorax marinus]|uniref:Uncharacterized protein n=1 Tax=Halobacteriovorax marinus TaxID=97084 RepID=A0A1Y5FAU9_9BACT|nr:hypothetical protein A9Q84_05135 [Halobacteriovorax marinus]
MKSEVVKNILFLLFENVFKILGGLVLGVWVARHLGPSHYGDLSYVLSLGLIFSPFYIMGQDEVVVKSLVENSELKGDVLGTAIGIKIIGGLIGLVVMNLVACFFLKVSQEIAIGVLIFSTFQMFKSLQVIEYYYLSIGNVKKLSTFRNFAFLATSIIKLTFILLKLNWVWFVVVSGIEVFLYGVTNLIVFSIDGNSFKVWKFDSELYKQFFKEMVPLVFISFFLMGFAKSDQIMISNFLGSEQLGNYAVANKLIELWSFVPLSIISILFPKIVMAASESKEKFEKESMRLSTVILWISLAFSVSVFVVSKPLVGFLYGSKYLFAGEILSYYCFLSIFFYFSMVQTKVLIVQGEIKSLILVSLLAFVLNIGINLKLIPEFGAIGAIFASIIAICIANILMALANKNCRTFCKLYLLSLFNVKDIFKLISKNR